MMLSRDSGFGVINFYLITILWIVSTWSMIFFMRAEEIQQLNDSPLHLGVCKLERWIAWSPFTWPWCKLNTDGAAKRSVESSAGGFIRDSNGKWIVGFGMHSCSVTVTELWGLYQGLTLEHCLAKGIPLVES